jgi:DNA-binding NtrC family response regulator
VLQEFEFEPVGSTKTQRVDTRVILATNEDLALAVQEGRFRQDLYYRVNVINIELPPLRERIADIPLLTQHFLARTSEEASKKTSRISDEALDALQRYHWPGNVRELQNVVERAVLLSRGDEIVVEDLPTHLAAGQATGLGASGSASGKALKDAMEAPERAIILEVLEMNNWNRNATADALGINRTTLYKKMKRLGLMESPRHVRS